MIIKCFTIAVINNTYNTTICDESRRKSSLVQYTPLVFLCTLFIEDGYCIRTYNLDSQKETD